MRARWPLFATLFGLGAIYVALPYVTLYRLGEAIRGADAATLQSLVDWPSVREGIKEDICDLVLDESPAQKASNELPAFGSSFVRGMAARSIENNVTPEALVEAVRPAVALKGVEPARPPGADVHVRWAFFESPTEFLVALNAAGQAEPIKLQLELRHGSWQVRRVWLPASLLEHANTRT